MSHPVTNGTTLEQVFEYKYLG